MKFLLSLFEISPLRFASVESDNGETIQIAKIQNSDKMSVNFLNFL